MRLEDGRSYLDLFTRPAATSRFDSAVPPPARDDSRAVVPLGPARPPVAADADAPGQPATDVDDAPVGRLEHLAGGPANLRAISPRDIQELALDIYAQGLLEFEDYAALAFQPELHPQYDATIGALTGERADPDRPRDYVRLWEDRLAFERRHNPENAPLVGQTQRIVNLLRQLDRPTDLSA